MLLKIVILIFIAMLLVLAAYLLTHRDKQFIIFNAKDDEKLQKIMTSVASALIVISVIGVVIAFTLPKQFNFITLFASVLVIFFFTISLTKHLNG